MNKIINKTVLLAALAVSGFACQSPELDSSALDTVVSEREALTVNRVQYVGDNLISETFAISLASEGVSVSYNDTWQPTYYGHGYFIQFEATAPVLTEEGGIPAAGMYNLSDTAIYMISRAYVTIIHDGASSSTAQTLALTDGTVKISEDAGNYTFDVEFTTVLGTKIQGHSAKAEKIHVEKSSYWFEPTAEDKVLKDTEWNVSEFSFKYSEDASGRYSENVLTLPTSAGTAVISYYDYAWDYATQGIIQNPTEPFPDSFYESLGVKSPYNALSAGIYEPETDGPWGGSFGSPDGGDISSYILMNSTETSGYSDVYWITGGKLDVTTSVVENKECLKIVADLQTSNGSTIKVTYDEAAAK